MALNVPPVKALGLVLLDPVAAIEYLVEQRVLEIPAFCPFPNCGGRMTLKDPAKPYLYRCTRKGKCGRTLSILRDTFFGNTKLSSDVVLFYAYLWLVQVPAVSIRAILHLSSKTVTDWGTHLRTLVTWDIENLDLAQAPIGGEGIIVEIDESKFGKRKFNRGHRVEGIWWLGESY